MKRENLLAVVYNWDDIHVYLMNALFTAQKIGNIAKRIKKLLAAESKY